MRRVVNRASWPPGRGFPTCPVCGEWITRDPGPGAVVPDPDAGWLVGLYAHRECATGPDQGDDT